MSVTSHFEIEPLILQVIRDLDLTGLKTVDDETVVAGNKNILGLLPAVILFTGQGFYSDGTDGGLQTETQYWHLNVIVPHYKGATEKTTASVAGEFITPILKALITGVSLTPNYSPLEAVNRPRGRYEDGMAEFEIMLKTSLDVGAGA